MGLLNSLFSSLSKNSKVKEVSSTVDRRALSASQIDEMQRIEASAGYRKMIYKRYYLGYPEKPYISQDREFNTGWIERADMFPDQCIIPKSMMKRYSDGLLPGHVYMLYWLKKYTNKKVPVYFEYKYGVDFTKEKEFLKGNGFLNDADKPTPKGEKAIKDHAKVVTDHKPKRIDPREQTLKQKKSFEANGYDEYEFIANSGCCSVCQGLNGKHFPVSDLRIGVNAPPMHDGCCCSISAYMDDEDYEAWLDLLSKKRTTQEQNRRKKHVLSKKN